VDNLPKVLVELELQYREQRHEFLEAAFKICWVALDWSAVQLDLGFPEIAASEARNVERSREIIVRFLSQVTDDGKRQLFESELHRVENALHLLRTALGATVDEELPTADDRISISFRPERGGRKILGDLPGDSRPNS